VLKKTLLLVLASAVLFDFTGCAMSAQARRERAYRHYVAKQKKQQQKEMARAQKEANREWKRKTKNLQPSEPIVTTSVQDFGMPSVFDAPAPTPPPAPVASSTKSPPTARKADRFNCAAGHRFRVNRSHGDAESRPAVAALIRRA
jgi:hypothetical protein